VGERAEPGELQDAQPGEGAGRGGHAPSLPVESVGG
jgi:hypothetical protein